MYFFLIYGIICKERSDNLLNIFLTLNFESFLEVFEKFANDNLLLMILIAIVLPFLESFVPMLPLVGIISFNIISLSKALGSTYGTILALVLSFVGSIIGMFTVFLLIRDLIGRRFREKIKKKEKIEKAIVWIENRSNTFMILFLSNPYVPTSIFNYAMALTKYSVKKYLIITVVSRTICVLLLGILGMVFDIGNDIKSILWLTLTYVGIYAIIMIIKKVVIKKENEHEKNY